MFMYAYHALASKLPQNHHSQVYLWLPWSIPSHYKLPSAINNTVSIKIIATTNNDKTKNVYTTAGFYKLISEANFSASADVFMIDCLFGYIALVWS